MCGIVGAVSHRNITPVLLEGIKRLEYRGYDSAGLALLSPQGEIETVRALGKVNILLDRLKRVPLQGSTGIAHTRWATHGEPNERNAHPHTSRNTFAIVHNGIIENYVVLREKLKKQGYQFSSETDSETIAHLIHAYAQKKSTLLEAFTAAVRQLEGAYSIAMISTEEPNSVYGVRSGSPLVAGFGKNENFIASDVLALLGSAKHFLYLEEGDIVHITQKKIEVWDRAGKSVKRTLHKTSNRIDQTSKGKYRHYMQKEIEEQPQVAMDALDGRFVHGKLLLQSFGVEAPRIFPKIKRVHIVACGTSYHAGLVAKYWLEDLAGIPCQVEVASENRYRKTVIESNTLFVALSQSGETADTLAALRQAKLRGYAGTLAICNVSASTLVREAQMSFMIRAGREIGVAATKTFTAQLIALLLLTTALSRNNAACISTESEVAKLLAQLPSLLNQALKTGSAIKKLSAQFAKTKDALFIGRGVEFPIALEGALKLKEISYIHAEAYPAGELKHGPLALVDKKMPVIAVAAQDELTHKLQSNIEEIITRQGRVIIFSDASIIWPKKIRANIIKLPKIPALLAPLVFNIPLQLLAYYVALVKGTDVDQPRNLAKSVTVE